MATSGVHYLPVVAAAHSNEDYGMEVGQDPPQIARKMIQLQRVPVRFARWAEPGRQNSFFLRSCIFT